MFYYIPLPPTREKAMQVPYITAPIYAEYISKPVVSAGMT
jgi:hypothetical protein